MTPIASLTAGPNGLFVDTPGWPGVLLKAKKSKKKFKFFSFTFAGPSS